MFISLTSPAFSSYFSFLLCVPGITFSEFQEFGELGPLIAAGSGCTGANQSRGVGCGRPSEDSL